jgi:hypothetical protein
MSVLPKSRAHNTPTWLGVVGHIDEWRFDRLLEIGGILLRWGIMRGTNKERFCFFLESRMLRD